MRYKPVHLRYFVSRVSWFEYDNWHIGDPFVENSKLSKREFGNEFRDDIFERTCLGIIIVDDLLC